MRISGLIIVLSSLASFAVAAPASYGKTQLPDGLPTPNPDQLKAIELAAHGTLSNAPPPPSISADGIVNLQLIAFNENSEVAFFDQLIYNITNKVDGYHIKDEKEYTTILAALKAILAQEELHELNANNALAHFMKDRILPCEYIFPVHDLESAITLASTFTPLVLATLQDVVDIFAVGGDHGLARGVTAVVGQEGEQQGFFRILQDKIPSELPFLTTGVRDFAFTALQGFIVPGSCPNINEIPLQTFEALTVLTPPGPHSQNINVQFNDPNYDASHSLWLTYINQQNLPIVEPLHIISHDGKWVKAEALFPFDANEMNGLSIAAVTNSAGPFANANAVAKATLAGPGLIIVN